jgi:hypothetical protein
VGAVCERILSTYEVSGEARVAAAEQLRQAERHIDVLTGRAPGRAALRRMRLALGRVQRRLLAGRLWYAEPPREVAEAFPELVGRRAG